MNSGMLTILGIFATLILGISSIYLALKRRYPGEITFYEEDTIS
jgi:hypothetical protein